MTTPSMLLTRWMGRGLLMVGGIVLATFAVSIAYDFHSEYNRQLIQRQEVPCAYSPPNPRNDARPRDADFWAAL